MAEVTEEAADIWAADIWVEDIWAAVILEGDIAAAVTADGASLVADTEVVMAGGVSAAAAFTAEVMDLTAASTDEVTAMDMAEPFTARVMATAGLAAMHADHCV